MNALNRIHGMASRDEDIARALALLHNPLPASCASAPLAVEIQPTAYCHRVCVFCSHIKRNRLHGRLSESVVATLLDQLDEMGVARIGFSGGGEPLTWGLDSLATAIERASTFAATSLTTSADQLWDAQRQTLVPQAVRLLAPLEVVYVNVPTVNAETWRDTVKGGPDWETARALFAALCALNRQGVVTTRFCAVVVLGEYNVAEIQTLDRTFQEIGFNGVYYKACKNDEQRNADRYRLTDALLIEAIDSIPAARRSPWIEHFLGQLSDLGNRTGCNPCWANRIQASAIVDPDGYVYPCSPVVGSADHRIGNINTESLRSIWSGHRRQQVVGTLDDRARAGGCPSECREHAFNEYVERNLLPSQSVPVQ